MSKLFDEVVHHTHGVTSADFFIHFRHDRHVLRCHTLVLQTQRTMFETLLEMSKFPVGLDIAPSDDVTPSPESPRSDSEGLDPTYNVPRSNSNGALVAAYNSTGEGLNGVTHCVVDDDYESFVEIIRFLYLNTLTIENVANFWGLLRLSDKYGVLDVATRCLSWIEKHFSPDAFYAFFDNGISLKNEALVERSENRFLTILKSRRHFQSVSEDPRWGNIPPRFFERLILEENLSLSGEEEIIRLLLRWVEKTQNRPVVLRILEKWRAPKELVFRSNDWTSFMAILLGGDEPVFSLTSPREKNCYLGPSFVIYRDAPGINGPKATTIPSSTGMRLQSGTEPISMYPRDLLFQENGFAWNAPEIPRLRVCLHCQVWAHKEKRLQQRGHSWSNTGPMPLMATDHISETVTWPPQLDTSAMKTMSQDDFDVGTFGGSSAVGVRVRQHANIPSFQVPEQTRIEHLVICGIISGRMRHGVTVAQEDRTSLYKVAIGEQSVILGGTSTSVEFELEFQISEPNSCGICQCTLQLHGMIADGDAPLLEEAFSASAQEALHFFICSTNFDANSSYQVELKWVDELIAAK
eukprot:GEMP01016772.1.p1 GENE.GEMP01016772.1~~GEMP01016772.1.p1  ORF type:complete len:579 (+),score=113.46 GEMP01016772.1:133-1869(+)